VDAEHPTGNQGGTRRAALRLVAVAVVVAVAGVAFSLLPHAKMVPPVATIAPTLPPLSPAPVVGLGFSAAADPPANEVVIFGGLNSRGRTWLLKGQEWFLATPHSSPTDRSGAVAGYDPVSQTVMLFGGTLAGGKGVDDTWAWNGSTWRRLDSGANGPPSGQGAQMAWDSAAAEMVLVTNGEATKTAETWIWRGSHWVRAPGGDVSASVFGDAMAYDPKSQTLLLVSPVAPDSSETVAQLWSGSAWEVITKHGPDIGAVGYYVPDNALFACGLATYTESVEIQSDCWEWTGSSWLQKVAVQPPPDSKRIIIEAEVSDTDNSRLIMFGWLVRAIPGQPQPLQDWTWDGEQWLVLG
jgi:hypothetical protein